MIVSVFAAVALASAPAPAPVELPTAPTSDAAAGAGTAKPVEEPKVCRMIEGTGSRMSRKKVCMTKDEWKAEERRNRR